MYGYIHFNFIFTIAIIVNLFTHLSKCIYIVSSFTTSLFKYLTHINDIIFSCKDFLLCYKIIGLPIPDTEGGNTSIKLSHSCPDKIPKINANYKSMNSVVQDVWNIITILIEPNLPLLSFQNNSLQSLWHTFSDISYILPLRKMSPGIILFF